MADNYLYSVVKVKNQIILRRKGSQETVIGILRVRGEGGVGERLRAKKKEGTSLVPPHLTKGSFPVLCIKI